ncbi:RecO [Catenovulum agarivorans DS-2]|uniref:DNA repair protein RecO n=1 Tax=Catenovulum agarivorans DS-2 TaxID=1328313 RepID=W7QEV7_9ALTE|nr:DNA repair protein RecO C-terminal domain-containing protein [Catenovulum agarivorans]EWH10456.1 RecO [Catenovulum agarivorans DS-2]
MTSTNLQQAMLLHCKPYRENSYIGDFISAEHGRVSVFFRKPKSGPAMGLFNLYLLTLTPGQNDLFFVKGYELEQSFDGLQGHYLFSAMYVNELLSYLLPKAEVDSSFFYLYRNTIAAIYKCQQDNSGENTNELEILLRCLELDLIAELGVMPDFLHTADDHSRIEPSKTYCFAPESGWLKQTNSPSNMCLSGNLIEKIAAKQFAEKGELRAIKQFMRCWLDHLLGHKKLKSRALFSQPKL